MDAEAARAYWTTLAQIAGVFIIPLVFEGRRAAARWSDKKRSVQRLQGLFFYFAAVSLSLTIVWSLSMLGAERSPTTVDLVWYPTLLGVVAIGLALPLGNYAAASVQEDLLIALRWMPWSTWRRTRRRFRRAEREFLETSREVVELRDDLARARKDVKKLRASLRLTIDSLLKRSGTSAALKVLNETSPSELGMPPEGIEKLRVVLRDPQAFYDETAAAYRRSNAAMKRLDKNIRRSIKLAEMFDQGRAKFTQMTYIAPEVRAYTDALIAGLEADARDQIESARSLQGEAEAALAQAREFTPGSDDQSTRPARSASD